MFLHRLFDLGRKSARQSNHINVGGIFTVLQNIKQLLRKSGVLTHEACCTFETELFKVFVEEGSKPFAIEEAVGMNRKKEFERQGSVSKSYSAT